LDKGSLFAKTLISVYICNISAVSNRLWQHARVVKVKKDNYYDIYFHYFAAVFAAVVAVAPPWKSLSICGGMIERHCNI